MINCMRIVCNVMRQSEMKFVFHTEAWKRRGEREMLYQQTQTTYRVNKAITIAMREGEQGKQEREREREREREMNK